MPTNDYFNFSRDNYPTSGKAFSAVMRALVDAINTSFALLPNLGEISGGYKSGTTTGDENAYLATIAGVAEYADHARFSIRFHTPSVGATPSLDINTLGPKDIRRRDGLDMDDGDLSDIREVVFDAQQDAFYMVDTPSSILSKIYYRNFTVTSTTMVFDYYPDKYFITEPKTLLTLWDYDTNITSVTQQQTSIPVVGTAYTSVQVVFPAGAVGKKGTIVTVGT